MSLAWTPGDPVYVGDSLAPQTPEKLPQPWPPRYPTRPLDAPSKNPVVRSPREEER